MHKNKQDQNQIGYNEYGQAIGFPVTDWAGASLPSRTCMDGRYVILKTVDSSDVCKSLFHAYCTDTRGTNWTYLPYGPFDTLAQFTQWFEKTCFASDPLFHVVKDKSTEKNIGIASYLRISPALGSIEVGHIHFSPLLQRTPLATEAMYLMMHQVFEESGFRRYEWKCDALNEPSKRAAMRLGFVYEGTFRQALTYKNRNRDTAWFSITDKEWPTLKEGFELWLSEDNFDDAGLQRKTLLECRGA